MFISELKRNVFVDCGQFNLFSHIYFLSCSSTYNRTEAESLTLFDGSGCNGYRNISERFMMLLWHGYWYKVSQLNNLVSSRAISTCFKIEMFKFAFLSSPYLIVFVIITYLNKFKKYLFWKHFYKCYCSSTAKILLKIV